MLKAIQVPDAPFQIGRWAEVSAIEIRPGGDELNGVLGRDSRSATKQAEFYSLTLMQRNNIRILTETG